MAPIAIIRVAGDHCEACGSMHKSVRTYGPAYRDREIRAGRADPGILCAGCADLWTSILRTGGTKSIKRSRHV